MGARQNQMNFAVVRLASLITYYNRTHMGLQVEETSRCEDRQHEASRYCWSGIRTRRRFVAMKMGQRIQKTATPHANKLANKCRDVGQEFGPTLYYIMCSIKLQVAVPICWARFRA